MKRPAVLLSVVVCLVVFLGGCSGREAEAEYKRLLDAELSGGEPKALVAQYEGLVNRYPDTDWATRARERLVALKAKLTADAEAAQRKAEQEAREKVEREREHQALKAEVERQTAVVFDEMKKTAVQRALGIHPNTAVERIAAYGEPKKTDDWERKVWAADVAFLIQLRGTLLGIDTFSEVIEAHGEVRLNEVTRQFERSTSVRVANAQ